MAARSCRQRLNVETINGDDLVAVAREQDNGSGVTDVGHASETEQSPHSPTERLIKCKDLDAPERLGQASLTRAAAPHLPENSGTCDRNVTAYLRGLQLDPHLTFVALQRHECPLSSTRVRPTSSFVSLADVGHAQLAGFAVGTPPDGRSPPR